MDRVILHVLDYFFLVFHAGLTVFNLVGWAWRRTRLANLVSLLLTGGSWFILGIFYGIGYCPLTDWHWRVLGRLGRTDLPRSYITYLIDRIIGLSVEGAFVERWTGILFFVALALSIILNVGGRRRDHTS
ncbi:MAG: DUF2784 domain-containing protein [Spirochaetales bacterium]|nr:DUF2784 domain-containing protein [Spirochaetales bacterium]